MTPTLEFQLSPTATEAWRQARAAADAGPHLGDGWIEYRRATGLEARYLLGRSTDDGGDSTDSVGVVYLARSRLKFWKRPQASVDTLPQPVGGESTTSDTDTQAATMRATALAELAQRERWQSLTVDSFDGPSPPPDLAAAGFSTRERFEFTIDLRPDDDARWSVIKQSHRRKIRKAEKAGIEITTAPHAAAELAALQQFTSDRRAERGEDMASLSEDRYRLLCDALHAAGDSGLAVIGRLDGEAVSAMLIASFGRRAYYLLGGTNQRGLQANAASLVFWEASRALRNRGIESLNLGGTPASAADEECPAHGLYRFKLGWGTTPAPCRSGVFPAV